MRLFEVIPFWYVVVALVWSTFQGCRGVLEHLAWGTYAKETTGKVWRRWVLVWVHDFVFRFICTLAGFFALRAAYEILAAGTVFRLDGAMLAGLVALGAIAVIGIGGQLHYVILLGKVGGKSSG